MGASRSIVRKAAGFRWDDVAVQNYRDQGSNFCGINRQILFGADGEGDVFDFVVRYFEIQPGGFSSLERHEHPHAVIVLRGEGKVIIDTRVHSLKPMDCVQIAPNCLHQLHCSGDEPFGFLCMINRKVYPARPATDAELKELTDYPEAAELARA